MKIVKLTSPLPDVLRLSSPRLRLRHGRRLALLSCPNLILNLCTLSLGSVAGSSSFSNFPNCSSPRDSASVFADYLRFYFSVSQPMALRSRDRGYLSELCRATCLSHAKASSSLWHGLSSSHFQSFLDSAFLSFYLEGIFHYPHP